MDNRWQMSKCGLTWQSSSEPAAVVASSPVSHVQAQDSSRNSMMNSGHYTYPHIVQEPSTSTRKLTVDPLFQTPNFNLYNSNLSAMGTPFFTLLSGPPYDSQQVLSSKPSTNVNVFSSSSTVGPTRHESSFGPTKLSPQNIDNRHLKSKTDIQIHPLGPIRSLASNGGNTAACLHEQLNGFTSLKNVHVSGPMPAQHGKLHSSSAHHPLSPTTNLPRVFCLYASGDLFLSYSGLLGVACSCHGFHMSISKFSEHSGLQDVNPGDAVHMDTGETIAQWRKVYFSKFGIRIPEDECGWNWPEGYATAADVAKSNKRVPNQTKFAVFSNSVGPSKPYAALDNCKLPNGFNETSQRNAHGGTDNVFKSVLTYSDKINNYRDRDIIEKTKVSSNIELRLGQPSQQNQTLGKLKVPGFDTRVSRVDHPLELVSSQRLIYNDAAVNCAAEAAKSGSTGQNQLRSSSLGFGAYSTRTTFQPDQLKPDVVTGSINSMLFSQINKPKDKIQREQYVKSQISKLGFDDHGSPRPITSRHVSPIPSFIPRPPSMVFSSMVLNPSPNMASSKSKVEGTMVLNSNTSSSNRSSFFGIEKDQNVLSNPLNGSLWSSVNVSSKSTASTYNLSELATKPVHSGNNSWIANVAEKSAVISVSQETSFRIGKDALQSNRYQTGPPLPRIGITEDICSSSAHENCFQGAYVPENCSCVVQKSQMVENSNLDGKTFLTAFGEPSKIKSHVLSNSNLQKDCTLRDGSISLGKIGESIKPNMKKVESNAFQWKDVPNKMTGKCHGSCRDESAAKIIEDRVDVIDQSTDVTVKSIDHQPVQKVDCMKEQVMSNISSKCSAPALTQASVKISNGDSCTDDAQNTDCAKNWSSDDCSNTGFDSFSCKTDSKNETWSKSVPDRSIRSTRNLVDELRVIDSLRMKKVPNHQAPIHENSTSKKTFEKEFELKKRKRETEFKILGKSFSASTNSSISTGNSGQSSQSLEDVHKLDKDQKRDYDDFLEIPEYSRGKKVRTDLEFSKIKSVWKQESPRRRFTRPVVCGRYGLISNGDTSKPAKIFSLERIIKTSRRCSPVGDEFVQKSPVKPMKKSIIREENQKTDGFYRFREEKCHIGKGGEVYSDDDTTETSDSDFGTQKRRKIKKIRKRSLYELSTKEKDSGFATIPKNIASIPQDNLKNGGNSKNLHGVENICRSPLELTCKSTSDVDKFCNVCGSSNNDELNCLLECDRCLIKVHQACYGISKVPKNDWYCRPCRENATNIACVLCGYEGGVMTRALHSNNIVRSLLNGWKVVTESQETKLNINAPENINCDHIRASSVADPMVKNTSYPVNDNLVKNSVTAGVFEPTVKQWVHMVCGLWTPDTRCPNVDTMSAFDVSAVCCPKENVVCSMCKRAGGSCIRCRVMGCTIHFHPWCAHQKGLLQSEVEGADNDKVGFYGRCELHATQDHHHNNTNATNSQSIQTLCPHEKETCARTEGYKGRKREGFRHDSQQNPSVGFIVQQEQVDAWNYINRQLLCKKRLRKTLHHTVQEVEADFRKEYARYKQSKGWKHLVVYRSGIHALGLYTSLFISQSAMVVEYVGEIVGLRVADRRETEYQSGKQLQYKSACYFFRIDKENIIDATRKGGIARFVNHSCQPNCVAKVMTVRGEKKVVFFAERDIYPGEEITYDYHFNNEDEGKKILCSCNSNNCRRYLN